MDIRTIRQLAEVMDQYRIKELTLEQNESKVHLVKNSFSSEPPVPRPVETPAEEVALPAQPSTPAPVEEEKTTFEITAPLVGTFFRSSAPETPALVSEGSHVEPDDVVCIIEALHVMNEIKADRAGTIARILVEDGTPVQFGQPLFELTE